MKARACIHTDPPCRSCINKRNRARGHETQRRAYKTLDIEVKYRGQRANEEAWGESPHSPSGKYRGLFQFDQSTWESVGGTGDPAQASIDEQYRRAEILLSRRGTQPWPVVGRRCS